MTRKDRIRSEYRRLRETQESAYIVGENARCLLEDARIRIAFQDAERAGLVRLKFVPDTQPFDDSYIDTWTDETEGKRERARKELWEQIEHDGVWGLIGEYRLSPAETISDGDDGWESTDGVWGFIGTETNGYEPDIREQTLSALRDALKSRCPCCRRPRSACA